MDTFVVALGIIGLVLLAIALIIIIYLIVAMIKKRLRFRKFLSYIVLFLILVGFGLASTSMALFLQTFSRYTHEDRVGWVYAYKDDGCMKMTFYNEQTNRLYWCSLSGDQWMIEGYFLRWSTFLRWVGAGSYYRVTRFSGRWVEPHDEPQDVYQMYPEQAVWKFLLTHGRKIPFIDAAYGIGAFQYPQEDTAYVYINDTGFILRTQ